MIWLPGVLSQGGEKYTWGRYQVSYTTVEGEKVSLRGSNRYIGVGETYSIVDGQFAVKTTNALRVTQSYSSSSSLITNTPYTIVVDGNVAFSSSQKVNETKYGSTLAKLTQITYVSASNITYYYLPYTIDETKGSYIDTVSDVNPDAYPDDGIQDGYWYVKVEH